MLPMLGFFSIYSRYSIYGIYDGIQGYGNEEGRSKDSLKDSYLYKLKGNSQTLIV